MFLSSNSWKQKNHTVFQISASSGSLSLKHSTDLKYLRTEVKSKAKYGKRQQDVWKDVDEFPLSKNSTHFEATRFDTLNKMEV